MMAENSAKPSDAVVEQAHCSKHFNPYCQDCRAALSTPHAEGTEPVAWIYRGQHEGEFAIYTAKAFDLLRAGWTETPLYSHPPKPADPLTELQRLGQEFDASETPKL